MVRRVQEVSQNYKVEACEASGRGRAWEPAPRNWDFFSGVMLFNRHSLCLSKKKGKKKEGNRDKKRREKGRKSGRREKKNARQLCNYIEAQGEKGESVSSDRRRKVRAFYASAKSGSDQAE